MKPTQLLDAFRNIQNRLVSFLSITITVTMGVGGLLCIFFVSFSLNRYASDFYSEHHFKDFEIISSMGISDANINRFKEADGIQDVEGVFVMDGLLTSGNTVHRVNMISVTERISTPQIKDGTMPEGEAQCALSPQVMEAYGISIGDQVTLEPGLTNMKKLLKERTFTVTGTFIHPDYMISNGNNTVLLPLEAFDRSELSDGYLRAFVYLEMDENAREIGNPDYHSISVSMDTVLRDLALEISKERQTEISDKAWSEYDKKEASAQDQLDEGLKKLKDGEQQLYSQEYDAEWKLAGAFEDLTGSELKFSDGLRQLLQGEQQYQDGLEQIANAKAQLAAGRARLDQGYAQLQQYSFIGSLFGFLLGGIDPLASARAQLAAGEAQYQQSVAALNQKIADADMTGASARIDGLWEKLKEGRAALDENWLSYEEKKQEADAKLAEGYIKLDDGNAEYIQKKEEAETKLADGRDQIESIDDTRFLVLNRSANEANVKFNSSVKSINGISMFFIPMFAIVGSLVIYSTMAIIIDEQKKQVGALKALGFRSGEIRNKYLFFGLLASLLGVIFGILLSQLLEQVILSTISNMYAPGSVKRAFHPGIAALVCFLTLLVAFIVAWVSCRNLLKSTAVGLLNGSEPAKKTWNKSSGKDRPLYSHLIISNIVTELPRVLVSITVLMASCLLIGMGLSLPTAFNTAFEKQKNAIYHFDLLITVDDNQDDDTKQHDNKIIEEVLNKHHMTYLPVSYAPASYMTQNESGAFYILCGDESKIRSYFDTSVDIPDSGILLPEKFMELQKFSDQNTMTVYDKKLIPYEVKVNGSYPLYVGVIGIMSPSAYKEVYGRDPQYNGFYSIGEDEELRLVEEELSKILPSAKIQDNNDFEVEYQSTKNLFNLVAVILVLISGVISFMILINLNSILVNRRMKELLIMKVNGFSNKQIIGYLLRETILINLLGIILGVVIGVLITYMMIRGLEPNAVMYIRSPSVLAWGGAGLINIVFAAVINTISFRKVGSIPLTDITKY